MITMMTHEKWPFAFKKEMIAGLLFLIIACSCSPNSKYESPPHYNLHHPEVIKVPEDLSEISGLCYYQADRSLFTESDEQGYIYKIPLDKPTHVKRWKVSQKRDYEDITMVDSIFYLLSSNGNIVSVQFSGNDSVTATKYDFPGDGKSEFEILYYDPQIRKLVMICKECEEERKTNNTAYAFDMREHNYGKLFVIDSRKAVAASATEASKFKPAGAAIHPLTGELYIISSVNKVLVIADRVGHIKTVYQLDPKRFHHPEGIAFNPSGGMYISNESEEPDPADILYFEYNKEIRE